MADRETPKEETLAVVEAPTNSLQVYPNPAKQSAVISYQSSVNSQQPIELVVVDVLGREVYKETSQSPILRTNLNVSQLAAGVYLVKVQDGEQKVGGRVGFQ